MTRENTPRVSRRALIAGTLAVPAGAAASGLLSGCGTAAASPGKLRLGYFANVTHGPAIVAVAKGFIDKQMPGVTIEPQIFGAGPDAVAAMLAGALDVSYMGPNPAVLAWVRTKGKGVRFLAGAAQNGAALVVRDSIKTLDDLRGKTVADPQVGGTQDVALKALLKSHHIPLGGGADDVEVIWMKNSQVLDQFKQGRLDATYQAEPWVSRLVVEAKAKVLVDERDSWPQHKFSTTCVLASQEYLKRCPEQAEALMRAHVAAIDWMKANPHAASSLINSELKRLTGKKLKKPVIQRAMKQVKFSADPMLANVQQVAEHSYDTGGLNVRADLHNFADLRPLNRALAAAHHPTYSDAGFGVTDKG